MTVPLSGISFFPLLTMSLLILIDNGFSPVAFITIYFHVVLFKSWEKAADAIL